MTDAARYLIRFASRWDAVFQKDGVWICTRDYLPVCKVGEEETKIDMARQFI